MGAAGAWVARGPGEPTLAARFSWNEVAAGTSATMVSAATRAEAAAAPARTAGAASAEAAGTASAEAGAAAESRCRHLRRGTGLLRKGPVLLWSLVPRLRLALESLGLRR